MPERSYRTFVVRSIVSECESVKSFHLVPEDGLPLDVYLPGQHLPLRLSLPGNSATLSRFYTISNYGDDYFRVTVRRELAEPGLSAPPQPHASAFFHDQVKISDRLLARSPGGSFWLDLKDERPLVMISGGIGVTPMMSMLEALDRTGSDREVYFFLAVRHGGHHVFRESLRDIAGRRKNLRMRVFYEYPRNQDIRGRDYQHIGKLDVAVLRDQLPSLRMPYLLCAPAAMMHSLSIGLAEAGVDPATIRTESFGGPRGVDAVPVYENAALQEFITKKTVTFARSDVVVPWKPDSVSVLQLAREQGIDISTGCEYGDCGTCMTRLLEGSVTYQYSPGARIDPGYCLPCIGRPAGSIILDI